MIDDSEAEKTSRIFLFLFGKPAWEMELEGADIDENMAKALEQLGDDLKERLHYLSRITRLLLQNGWSASGGLYDISFYKDAAPEVARKELAALGLSPDEIQVEEEEWDEDDIGRPEGELASVDKPKAPAKSALKYPVGLSSDESAS